MNQEVKQQEIREKEIQNQLETMQKKQKVLKYVIVGSEGVGKTAIISQFQRREFIEKPASTIGVQLSQKEIIVDNVSINLQIWDTVGKKSYQALMLPHYSQAKGIFIVYDMTRRETFDRLKELIMSSRKKNSKDVLVFLVANKLDMCEERVVSRQEGEEFAGQNGLTYFEVSAKDGESIQRLFEVSTSNVLLFLSQRRNFFFKFRLQSGYIFVSFLIVFALYKVIKR